MSKTLLKKFITEALATTAPRDRHQTDQLGLDEILPWFSNGEPTNVKLLKLIGGRELSKEAEEWFWDNYGAVF